MANRKESISRRTFLREASLVVGGATLFTGCNAPAEAIPTSQTTPATGAPAGTTAPGSSSPTSASTPTASAVTPTPTSTAFVYTPKRGPEIPTIDVKGCSSKVATDRGYTMDHIWALALPGNLAVLGMSDYLQYLAYPYDKTPSDLRLLPAGTALAQGDYFGNFCGQKLSVDLFSPVSGTILETNPLLAMDINPLRNDPYGDAWLVIVRLAKPEELKGLVTPQAYAQALAK